MPVVAWEDLHLHRQSRTKPKLLPMKPCIGFDTETTATGDLVLLADSEGRTLQYFEKEPVLEEILKFLTNPDYEGCHLGFWNLSFDRDTILKLLPQFVLKEVLEKGEAYYGVYRLRIIGNKAFQIKLGRNTWHYADWFQFFRKKLETASQDYLGEGKLPFDCHAKTRAWWNDNRTAAISYCIRDSQLAARLMQERLKTYETLKITPKRLYSPAHLSEIYFRSHCYIPLASHTPRGALEYAWKSYYGGRFELLKRGTYWDTVYAYDINSAYPDKIRSLYNLKKGRWLHSKTPVPGAIYGFVKAYITTRPGLLQALPRRKPSGLITFPMFNGEGIYYYRELEAARTLGLLEYEVADGWWWLPTQTEQPFRKAVEELHQARLDSKDKAQKDVLKQISNSFYGKQAQKTKRKGVWQTGNLWNPIYASVITAETRIQLLEAAMQHPEAIIELSTDGILSTKPLDLEIHQTRLGAWKHCTYTNITCLQSGVRSVYAGHVKYCRHPKKDGECIEGCAHYMRGFERAHDLRKLLQESVITNEDGELVIEFQKRRPVHLREASIQSRILQVNQWDVFRKELDLNGDQKRDWSGVFQTGEEALYDWHDSHPILEGLQALTPSPEEEAVSWWEKYAGEDTYKDMSSDVSREEYLKNEMYFAQRE